ncbi:MAG TPA: metallophosphoesterase [Thermoanaerobaculia bacterium]|jgi:hypothetical protein|nr:metallophosphoesterase [Thermoanaerobaculia bacterium]
MAPITLLHLSDFHAGLDELRDEDQKQHISGVQTTRLIARLTTYLERLDKCPDYVVITGDITNRGDLSGFQQVREWLLTNIERGILPDPKRILITPGNHDVKWGVEKGADWHVKRYEGFWNHFGRLLPHSHIPGYDQFADPHKLEVNAESLELIGGMTTKQEQDTITVTSSYPFLLDLEHDILIFAFNSSLACGVYQEGDKIFQSSLDSLTSEASQRFRQRLVLLREAYHKSLLIDAGYVNDDQLSHFGQLIQRIKQLGDSRYARLTKIAILHHHLGHLWDQQLEVKNYEAVLDAAKVKQYLVELQFDLILHGHKHLGHVGLDSSIVPMTTKKLLGPLCIVAGGTIGGYPRTGHYQTFKLISFQEDRGPRRSAIVSEIPLLDRADTKTAMREEAIQYKVPLSSRQSELHDLAPMKMQFDLMLRAKLAPELDAESSSVVPGQDTLPRANPDLVAATSRYILDFVVHEQGVKFLYTLVLAVDKIDFRQRARIYWLLTDVKAMIASSGARCKVVLLIGNLEETHFFLGERRGEVKGSIEKLERWFAPAREGGILEIRTHSFSQEEVERIMRASEEGF